MRQDRIAGVGAERAPGRMAAQHDLGMLRAGTALGAHQVVPAAAFVQVRTLDPDRVVRQVHTAVDQDRAMPDQPARCQIELLDPDGAVSVVPWLARWRPIVQHVAAPIIVEEQ